MASVLRAATAALLLAAIAIAAFLAAAAFGDQPVSLHRAFADATSPDGVIFFSLRVPRALLAAIVGAALATSGAALQGLLRNPLADPFILGVSGGAALGATVCLAFGITTFGTLITVSAPAVCAFLGAIGATALVFFMGRVAGRSTPYSVLLAGTVFNAFALAAITVIRSIAQPGQVNGILSFLLGTLGFEDTSTLVATWALELFAIGGLILLSGRINVLALGDDEAASLGVDVERTRLLVLALASLAVAGGITLTGLIGFVGLIVPHLLRLWLGPDARRLIPLSALGGAALLLLADLSTRLLFQVFKQELPVGVITAMLGGPFFMLLLHRGNAEAQPR